MKKVLTPAALAALAVAVFAVAGCGSKNQSGTADSSSTAPLKVVTNFYPIEEAARRIGGNSVSVTDLTPVGAEPHDIELTPKGVTALENANVVLYLGQEFQPAVEKAVGDLPSSTKTADLLQNAALIPAAVGIPGVRGEVEGGAGESLKAGMDPHVWVDPEQYVTLVEQARDAMISADPSKKAEFTANAEAYIKQLQTLGSQFKSGLANCKTNVLVTSHAAFGYLAKRYGLKQAAIAGISPEQEPDPKSLQALAKFAKQNGVKTVYFESLVPQRLSDTLAREIGAKTDALNPLED